MNAYDIIKKKRDGGELSSEEIMFFVQGLTSGTIPDYQVAAWAMAVYFRGMTGRETRDLALAMADSGDTVDLRGIEGFKVDKHSTGGVGDKTTLVVIPLVAAAGVPVAKMSGRGLGHTGGTIDKFESIPNFQVDKTPGEFIAQVNSVKAAVVSQTGNLVPADKKLYALRDVTATVDSIPLIAASIMSKKLASGADGIVLDVKVGSGAFMKSSEEAFELARIMVDIGTSAGREVVAVLSDMDQPLGYTVGNALEVQEAIATLKGKGPADLEELSIILASYMLLMSKQVPDLATAQQVIGELLHSGKGLQKLREMVVAQGGDPGYLDNPHNFGQASLNVTVPSPESGVVSGIDAEKVGLTAMRLGAGREKLGDRIDHTVGIVLRKKRGDRVRAGEALAILHANDPYRLEVARKSLVEAYRISTGAHSFPPLLLGVVTREGVERYV
ncbi:MAG: pyrimidine-nucleoside phosphorylase [Syntrophomonadaceae bacterium]|nr:pyrimidine-nucleoside phosphorylase [Syntrophomonadaceae bacterium]